MLPVMNVKQLAELERILLGSAPTAVRPTFKPPEPDKLKHIANLASVYPLAAESLPPAEPISPPPFGRIWKRPQQVASESSPQTASPLSPPKIPRSNNPEPAEPVMSSNIPPAPVPRPPLSPPAPVPKPPRPAASQTASQSSPPIFKPVEQQNTAPFNDVASSYIVPEISHIASLNDIAKINVLTLRAIGLINLLSALTGLIKKHDYLSVELMFEQSPLYRNYLDIGRKVLAEGISFEQAATAVGRSSGVVMNRSEFEEVADILRKIQIN